MTHSDGLVMAFALGMLPKVEWLRTGTATPVQASAVRSSLTQELRKLCDALGPEDLRPAVSRRAATAAEAIGVDLCRQSWATQLRFDPGRRMFHLEHVVPVSAIRAAVLECGDAAEIVRTLAGLRLAWILKEENQELERRGFRSRRPDPDAAYAEAGIELTACHGL
jgi:hypothetical protein